MHRRVPGKSCDWPTASQKLLKGGRPVAYHNAYRYIRRSHGNGSCLHLVMLIYRLTKEYRKGDRFKRSPSMWFPPSPAPLLRISTNMHLHASVWFQGYTWF